MAEKMFNLDGFLNQKMKSMGKSDGRNEGDIVGSVSWVPTRFLKLDDLFEDLEIDDDEGDLENCVGIYDFSEGIYVVGNSEMNTSTHAHGTATWRQRNFEILLPFGDYYSVIRNAVAARKPFDEGGIIEKIFVDGTLSTVVKYTLENILIEEVLRPSSASNLIYLELRPKIIEIECSRFDPEENAISGNQVSRIDNVKMSVE